MPDTPEAHAAAFEEPMPVDATGEDRLRAVDDDPETDPAELGRARRIADIAVVLSFVVKVVWFMTASRRWFYAADDWDYLTREGIRQIFDPHTDHLTAVVSGYAIAVRPLVGLDYWPGYAILPAVSIPLIGAAAYWVWRRNHLPPVVGAAAAIFLMWMGTSGWVQYGHAGAGIALAATIVAIDIDQRRLRTGTVAAGLGFTVLATIASTTGAIGTIGRMIAALIRREWTGLASTAPVVAGYLWYRGVHGSTADPVLDPGDVFTGLGVAFQLIGDGLLFVIPWSSTFAWVLGMVMIALAAVSLLVSRFSYTSMSIVALGTGYVLSVVAYRYLSRPDRLGVLQENGLDLDVPAAPRYAMVFTVVVLIAVVPLVAGWFTTRARALALIAVTAVLIGIGAYHTIGRHELIQDRSSIVASRLAGNLAFSDLGEPTVSEGQRIDPVVGKALTFERLEWLVDEGLDGSMLASDIYRAGDVPITPAEATRGRMRLNLWPKGKIEGTWSDLGVESQTRCVPLEAGASFEVMAPVLYRLEVTESDFLILLVWEDQYGRGTVMAGDQLSDVDGVLVANETTRKDDRAVMYVKTAAPEPSDPPPIMTIEARNELGPVDVSMCLDKSPAAGS